MATIPAPGRAGTSARGWRLAAPTTSSGFAWDVTRLRFQSDDNEEVGIAIDSGHASESFRPKYAFRDTSSMWGGRPDDTGRFHIGLFDTSEFPVTHVVLEQGLDHWAERLDIEMLNADGLWVRFARVTGLRPGSNTIDLVRLHEHGPQIRLFTPDPSADRRILITIASYRDPELANTVSSALHQAAYPEHLRFAICHQYDESVSGLLSPWADDPRFSIDEVPHGESRGCCWARARTFDLFDDEAYLLQIDAHTRFAPRWDVRFIEMLESIDADLPLLTTYPPPFTLDDDGSVIHHLDAGLQKLVIKELRPDLTTLQVTTVVRLPVTAPGVSPTLAAGQIFTRGRFCRDVPYDPNMYFAGEEISLAARAFTSGYDLFYPDETLLWHLYDHDHAKHWEDNTDYTTAHDAAMARLKTLFQGDSTELGKYGLGTKRSLAEFEGAAGIRLTAVDRDPGAGVVIDIDRSAIRPRDDYDHFLVSFLDHHGNEVARRSIHAPDVLDLSRATVKFHDLERNGASAYIVLPMQRNGTVGKPILRPLGTAVVGFGDV